MFVITVEGRKYRWDNSLQDDFIPSIAKHFGVAESDLQVEYVPEEAERFIRGATNRDPDGRYLVSMAEEGKIILCKFVSDKPGDVLSVKSFDLIRVVSWKHSDDGKFLGNELAK